MRGSTFLGSTHWLLLKCCCLWQETKTGVQDCVYLAQTASALLLISERGWRKGWEGAREGVGGARKGWEEVGGTRKEEGVFNKEKIKQ